LRKDFQVERDLFQTLLDSWVLAQLADCDQGCDDLVHRLDAAERLLGKARGSEDPLSQVDRTLASLVDRGLVVVGARTMASLTPEGRDLVDESAAVSELMHDHFLESLRSRAATSVSVEVSGRVAAAAAGFFVTSLENRALAVALMLNSPGDGEQEFNAVQMLQTLPSYMEQLEGFEEAVALSDVVRAVLTEPNDVERKFLGTTLQATFAVHLLGLDQDTLLKRVQQFQGTAFVLDSNVLIPLLATGSKAHEMARYLVSNLEAMGCTAVTTPLLIAEVAEHAGWAVSNDEDGDSALRQLAQLTGRSDYKTNAFLEGYVAARADANGPPTLVGYLEMVACLEPGKTRVSPVHIASILEEAGVAVVDLNSALRDDSSKRQEVDEYVKAIEVTRRERGTYKHDRQVRAEAVVVFLVKQFRDGRGNSLGDFDEIDDSYFISTSGVVDDPTKHGRPITIGTAAATQWLATLNPQFSDGAMRALVDGLLAELQTSGAEFVNRRQLTAAFSPLIEESGRQMALAIDKHHGLALSEYSSDGSDAFSKVDPMDIPSAFVAIVAQAEDRIAGKIEAARRAEKDAKFAEKERQAFNQLKAGDEKRKAKYQKRMARIKSQPKRKRRRRRRRRS